MSDLAPQTLRAGVWCLLIATAAQTGAEPVSPATGDEDAAASPPGQTVPSPDTETPVTARPGPNAAPGAPRIIYQGRVVPYRTDYERRRPENRPRGHRQRRSRTVIVPAAPATLPEPATPPASPTEAHASVAGRHAYQHFRYKFKVGSTHYGVTSLNILTEETVEVAGWNQYRTTGEAGIEYYDNAGPKRAVRRFEVLTEAKDGRIVPVDITVK